MTKRVTESKKRTKTVATSPTEEPARPKPKPAMQQQDKIQDAEHEIARLKGMMNICFCALMIGLTSQFAGQLAQAIDAQRRAEADKARGEAKVAKKEAELRAKAIGLKTATPMIPKPKAADMSEGVDRLRKAMGLIDDRATYLAILVILNEIFLLIPY
jgi:hypothetical protein